MLSDPEQRVLDGMAQRFRVDDPEFCQVFTDPDGDHDDGRRLLVRTAALGATALGVLGAIVGVLVLSIGTLFLGCLVAATGWGGCSCSCGPATAWSATEQATTGPTGRGPDHSVVACTTTRDGVSPSP